LISNRDEALQGIDGSFKLGEFTFDLLSGNFIIKSILQPFYRACRKLRLFDKRCPAIGFRPGILCLCRLMKVKPVSISTARNTANASCAR
jgi:hypothetical protein